MAFHYSPKIVTDGLILYMDPANINSYPGTGATWSDLGRNMNSGLLRDGYAYDSSSKSFTAISATSTTPTWISTDTMLSFADSSAYSMEFSVKLRPNAQYTYHSLCGNVSTHPWVGIYGYGTLWFFFFREASAGIYSVSPTFAGYDLSKDWATLGFTVATDRTIKFYLNGSFVSNTSPSVPTTLLNVSRLAGGYSSSENRFPFQGSVSAIRIYNRTLSNSEMLINYNAMKSRFGI